MQLRRHKQSGKDDISVEIWKTLDISTLYVIFDYGDAWNQNNLSLQIFGFFCSP